VNISCLWRDRRHYSGNGRSGLLGCERRQCSGCSNNIDLEVHQLSRHIAQPVRMILCKSISERNILPFNPAQFAESLNERSFVPTCQADTASD
jgi:hypothetical protein